MSGSELPTVLIVDDEREVADIYAQQLDDDYDVRTVYDGEETLERIDEAVDVVLLDRRMPGISGDEVLETVRERGLECNVVMVTAVDPDLDIVDMDFDDYLVKPISGDDVRDVVERVLERSERGGAVREYLAVASKLATLRVELSPSELRRSDEIADLEARLEELREEADVPPSAFDSDLD